MTDWPETLLLDTLDQALATGLLRVDQTTPPATYDFSHAIVRQTIIAGLNSDRQARLHRQAVQALEAVYAGRLVEQVANLASHYHASLALPAAEHGLTYALQAAEIASASGALAQAVMALRQARDLASDRPLTEQAEVLQRLALAEIAALSLDEAHQTIAAALAALRASASLTTTIVTFLTAATSGLKEAGAANASWLPLLEHGIALTSAEHDLNWARLMLSRPRGLPFTIDDVTVERRQPLAAEAVAIARQHGSEEDYAATLDPLDWRPATETATVLALAERWQRLPAILRALDVATRDLIYRHGDLQGALAPLERLLSLAQRHGSLPRQVEALVQLAFCRIQLGQRQRSQVLIDQARELAGRLGWAHRLRFGETAIGSIAAYYYEGDWASLAAAADHSLALVEPAAH
jgi:hypothetical protein